MTKLTPYSYQEEAIAFASNQRGSIIADECGLGKTLIAIETAIRVRKTHKWRCLVIVPPSLLAQWVDAIAAQDDEEQFIYVPGRIPVDYSKLEGWIINDYYAMYDNYVRERIYKVLWDVVILDEAHRIKNRQADISKYVRKLHKVRGICLTATPMEKGPADLWSLLNFADRHAFPGFHGFTSKHLIVKDNYWGGKLYGAPKNPEAFGRMTGEYMMRRTKKQVASELPARIDIPVRVGLMPDQIVIYNKIKEADDILVQVEDQELLITNILTQITRLQQISVDPSLLGFTAQSGKLLWLKEWISDHPDERIVVFTRFRTVALNLARTYRGHHIVGGNISSGFDENTFDRVFGTIDAMGEGLNLQRATSAIFLDAHWSTTKMTQALDRIHRINILSPRNVYLLESARCDIIVYKAISKKWSVQELVYNYLHS